MALLCVGFHNLLNILLCHPHAVFFNVYVYVYMYRVVMGKVQYLYGLMVMVAKQMIVQLMVILVVYILYQLEL